MAHTAFCSIQGAFVRLRYNLLRPFRFIRSALFGRKRSLYSRYLSARVEHNRCHPDIPGESQLELVTRLRDEFHGLRLRLSRNQLKRELIRLERDVAKHALREDPAVRRFRQAEHALQIRLAQPDAAGIRERFEKGECTCGN